MPDFGDSERHVLGLFREGTVIRVNDRRRQVVFAGKPTCSEGEPKTDIFIRCKDCDSGAFDDIKISYKQSNADFLENKIKAERAQEIFGDNWSGVIKKATQGLRAKFENRPLVYKVASGRTEKGAITLGWKFELLNTCSGELTGEMLLSDMQKIDVFAGRNLSEDKKNAQVNGCRIENSGVANYMLMSDSIGTAQDVINSMRPIEEYAKEHKVYFACKALNFRSLHIPPKWDGNRPLAVQVDWTVQSGKLTPELDFDHPLVRKGNEMGDKLKIALTQLGARDTKSLTALNCSCLYSPLV